MIDARNLHYIDDKSSVDYGHAIDAARNYPELAAVIKGQLDMKWQTHQQESADAIAAAQSELDAAHARITDLGGEDLAKRKADERRALEVRAMIADAQAELAKLEA